MWPPHSDYNPINADFTLQPINQQQPAKSQDLQQPIYTTINHGISEYVVFNEGWGALRPPEDF